MTDSMHELLTITETAAVLHVSRGEAYRLVRQEGLPVVRMGAGGRVLRVNPESLAAWLAARETRQGAPAVDAAAPVPVKLRLADRVARYAAEARRRVAACR